MSMKLKLLILFSIGAAQISRWVIMAQNPTISSLLLFDFQNVTNLDNWIEQSDTVRSVGKSKATFDLYKTQTNQSAILFTLLNPQPNGACFSGVRTSTQLNLDGYECITFVCQAKGNATIYKIVLRHNNLNDEPNPTFEQKFKVNTDSDTTVKIPISEFKPYYRGKIITNGSTLNVKNITNFGIQVAGGVYEEFKQSGLSSFVVDQIWAERNGDKN